MPRRSDGEGSPKSARAVRLPGTAREVITRGTHPSGAEGVPVTSRSRVDASTATDAEVKVAYRELRRSYRADRYKRRLYRRYRRDLGKAVRSDHRRSRLYVLRKAKWISVMMFVYGGYLGFSNGIFAFPARDPSKLLIEYFPLWVRGNLQAFVEHLPDVAPVVLGLFGLGVEDKFLEFGTARSLELFVDFFDGTDGKFLHVGNGRAFAVEDPERFFRLASLIEVVRLADFGDTNLIGDLGTLLDDLLHTTDRAGIRRLVMRLKGGRESLAIIILVPVTIKVCRIFLSQVRNIIHVVAPSRRILGSVLDIFRFYRCIRIIHRIRIIRT